MKKTDILKGLSCLLVISSLCFSLAACGVDGSGDVQNGVTDNSAYNTINSGERQSGVIDNPANSFDSNGVDESGETQPNIMDNPAYNPGDRQVLAVGITWLRRETLDRILAFNERNPSYFIEIKSYYNGLDTEAAKKLDTQLSLDILSGEGPDLMIWDNSFYTPALVSGKLMVNLHDFMDADPDFHREDYFENILQAFEINGELYILPASFTVYIACGKAEELGTDRGITESWEFGEMLEAYENSPHAEMFSDYFNKKSTLCYMCGHCMDHFVDWGSGECHFDTPEFVELLEWCDTFPEQFQDHITYEGRAILEALRSGQIFWHFVHLSEPWTVAYMRASSGDADLLWPGHPVADGERDLGGGVAAPYGECYSICQNSGNQEAAWEVIKYFLTEDAQREVRGIPLLRSVSEERIQDALTLEYETVDGVKQEKIKYDIMLVIVEGDEEIFEFSCITEEDAETYRSIIENTHRSYGGDYGIRDIILEEEGAYFGKDKDAATVADIIQNRVYIYVSERVK